MAFSAEVAPRAANQALVPAMLISPPRKQPVKCQGVFGSAVSGGANVRVNTARNHRGNA